MAAQSRPVPANPCTRHRANGHKETECFKLEPDQSASQRIQLHAADEKQYRLKEEAAREAEKKEPLTQPRLQERKAGSYVDARHSPGQGAGTETVTGYRDSELGGLARNRFSVRSVYTHVCMYR